MHSHYHSMGRRAEATATRRTLHLHIQSTASSDAANCMFATKEYHSSHNVMLGEDTGEFMEAKSKDKKVPRKSNSYLQDMWAILTSNMMKSSFAYSRNSMHTGLTFAHITN